MGFTATTPAEISAFQMLALKGALKLEVLGMRRRGPSALSLVKRQFKFKGTKASVLAQLEAHLRGIGVLATPAPAAGLHGPTTPTVFNI